MKITKEQLQWLAEQELMLSNCTWYEKYDDCYISNNNDYNDCFVVSKELIEYVNSNMPELNNTELLEEK